MTSIVVGVDGSAEAQAALRFALVEARLRHARVRAVHAWIVPPPTYTGGPFVLVPDVRDELAQRARNTVAAALAAAADAADGIEVETVVVEDRPAHALVTQARGADLLVVGSRGRGAVAGALLGSVSQGCLHHAPCPVVVVPRPRATA